LTKTPGTYWAFLPTSWVQFDGFENVANPEHKGTWKDENGVLKIIASDGTSYDTASGDWTKAKPKMQWVKNNGFPLKFGQMTGKYPNGIIGKFQVALNAGMSGDGYFGRTTEKFVKAKFPNYVRETGVTEEMYNSVVTKPYAYTDDMDTPESLAARQANQETFK
jgi:hypothetical protein